MLYFLKQENIANLIRYQLSRRIDMTYAQKLTKRNSTFYLSRLANPTTEFNQTVDNSGNNMSRIQ
jgi:hypothetical protein